MSYFLFPFRLTFNMTGEVLVRGEVKILKGANGMSLDDTIMMIENAQMKVVTSSSILIKWKKPKKNILVRLREQSQFDLKTA